MPEENEKRALSLEELTYLERVYQNQHMLVTNAINAAVEELQELGSASKSMESIDSISGKDSFTNLGGNFFVMTKVKEEKTVVVGVGGGYLVEKKMEDAAAYIKGMIGRKNELISKMMKSRKELETTIIELNSKLEHMAKGHKHV